MDWIQGERFKKLADNKTIYYCHTHDVGAFLSNISFSHPFILISHNSDGAVRRIAKRREDACIQLMPANLVHWFGQNIDVEHEKISSLPIGIENNEWADKERKKERMLAKGKQIKILRNLLYINHNIKTNPKEREEPYKLFQDVSWATCEQGRHGHGFVNYLDSIYNHNFVICPEGNGIDTHRTWECLYMGTIPIEKRNINNQFYQDLPICFVDDWKEVTEDFLKMEYIRIKTSEWNMEKLTFEYWKNRILDYVK